MLINKELTIKLSEELKAQFSEIAKFTKDHEFLLEGDFSYIDDTISFQRCNVVYNIDCLSGLLACGESKYLPFENSKIAVVKFAVLNDNEKITRDGVNIWEIFNTAIYADNLIDVVSQEYYEQLIFDLSIPKHLELYNKFIIEALKFIG